MFEDGMDTGETEPLDGEIVEESPRVGTLAWLHLQPHEDVHGIELPAVHRIGEGMSLAEGPDDGRCKVIRADGNRCKSPRLRDYGVCLVHAGGGGFSDPAAMSQKAHAVKLARRERRELLGIGPRRAASARSIARVRAMERAEDMAAAIVDGPLDDSSLSTFERQTAALRALDATYPLASTSVEVTLPATAQDAAGMGWAEMRELAARLLDSPQD
jgi:hypothetical protein